MRLIISLIFSLLVSFSWAQDNTEKVRILFIFDGSNSMNAQWQKSSKIKIAKKLMLETLDSLKKIENVELALRLYGHQTKILPGKQDCNDTELVVPFGPSDVQAQQIKNQLRALTCQGTTPIALSLEQAGKNDFPDCENCRNVIILISDGIEACDGDPCAVSKALSKKGIKLKPFIIGIGLDTSYLGQFQCVGEFLSAETEDSFESVLGYVISQAVNNTTVQVYLNDDNGKPKETDVTMSFYNKKNGAHYESYMHTINAKRVPDTIALNPLFAYDLVVYTIPPLTKEDIKLKPGTHNIIQLDAPQGYLNIRTSSNPNQSLAIGCIVREKDRMTTLNHQKLNTKHKYLTGTYDLEILTLPRIYIEDVNIKQGLTSDIIIPNAGSLTINKGEGPCQVFQLVEGKEIWVCNVEENSYQEYISLQPGKYRVVYRRGNAISVSAKIIKDIKIVPGYDELLEF